MKVVTRGSLLLALLLGCGGDGSEKGDDTPGTTLGGDGDGDAPTCVDLDGDGFGKNCADGPDCDDYDDSIFEGCDTCNQVREGCACEDEAPVECKIPTGEIVDGVLLCKTGMRYCRDGAWTTCIGVVSFSE